MAHEGVVEFGAELRAQGLEGGREDAGEGARVGLVEFKAENALARPLRRLKRGLYAAYAAVECEWAVDGPAQALQKDAGDASRRRRGGDRLVAEAGDDARFRGVDPRPGADDFVAVP